MMELHMKSRHVLELTPPSNMTLEFSFMEKWFKKKISLIYKKWLSPLCMVCFKNNKIFVENIRI